MQRFIDSFSSHGWLGRVFCSGHDYAAFACIWRDLDSSVADLNSHLALSNRAIMESLLAAKQPAFADETAALRSKVADLGGVEAVTADMDKMQQVTSAMGVNEQLLLSELRQTRADAAFPDRLPVDAQRVLKPLLRSGDTRDAVMAVILRQRQSESVLAVDIAQAYLLPDALLVDIVTNMLAQTPATKAADPELRPLLEPDSAINIEPPALQSTCALPPLPKHFVGRDDAVAQLASFLESPVSVCMLLHGGPGQGKSALAAAVGRHLWGQGLLPGGALYADLKGVGTQAAALNKIALSMGIKQGNAPEAAIVASLRAKAKQQVLLLLDNAEDMALAEPEAQALKALLAAAVPGCQACSCW
ncbi:hypothetical protein WJX82_004402 [Trebouxia sp. C0006]